MTIDEHLVPFRDGCHFKQRIPSKSAKYGINILWDCDDGNCYPVKRMMSVLVDDQVEPDKMV